MAASARRLARAATVAALVAVTTGMPQAESAGQSCVAMRVRDDGGPSTVDRTEYPAVATTKLGRVPYRLNALGYLRSRDLAYGVTPDGHVVTIDRRGRTADLGEPDGRTLAGATAGTISGKVWYVKRGALLSLVDIEPGSVSVRSSVVLRPALLAARVDDFVLVDGLLYGVASEGEVVTIDPDSGEVRTLPGKELPPHERVRLGGRRPGRRAVHHGERGTGAQPGVPGGGLGRCGDGGVAAGQRPGGLGQ